MPKQGWGFGLRQILAVLLLLAAGQPAGAVECLSPSYSVQKGREALSDIEPRNLVGNEFQELSELFQGLVGSWAGNGRIVKCEGPEDNIRKETESFTVESRGTTDSAGQLTLASTLYWPEQRVRQQEAFHLFLSQDRLATRPDISASDIELVSVSRDGLMIVKKNRARGDGGALIGQETVTRIQRRGDAAMTVENVLYVHGKLTACSAWQLERK
jgi:hypothetical protein